MTQTIAFDLDGTLISNDSGEDWLEFLLAKELHLAREARAECLTHMQDYSLGTMDIQAYMKSWCKPVAGMSMNDCEPLLQEFVALKVKPHIFTQAKTLLSQLQQQQAHILLVSASPDFLVKAIAKELGINNAVGLQVLIKDQVITDKITKPHTFKEGKVVAVNNWLAGLPVPEHNKKLDLAYSDSINDLPLLEMAEQAICINPDKKLTEVAKNAKWQILNWS